MSAERGRGGENNALTNSLLRQSTLSATEIALATGFGSSSHFSLAFHRWFGMTPSDVRDGGAVASSTRPVENCAPARPTRPATERR